MNIYVAHARILHKEPPKEEGRSGLMILKIGRDKPETESLIQSVNQVIIRIPPFLTARAATLPVDSYVEVFGHVGGFVRRSAFDGRQHPGTEITASSLQPAVPHGQETDPDRRLFNRWIAIGLMRGFRAPVRDNLPGTAYVQIGRDRVDRGRNFQHTGVVPILAYGPQIERLSQVAAGEPIHLEGHVSGLLRRVPRPGAEGDFESLLDAGLVVEHWRQTSVVAERLLDPETPPAPMPDAEAPGAEIPEEPPADVAAH